MSVDENIILSRTGDVSMTEFSNVPTLDSESPSDKSMTWPDVVVCMDRDGLIEYERMSSECNMAQGLVAVSESNIPMELENGKAWQPSGEPCDCDFYICLRAFPGTWGASMQWCLWYVRNMGCGACQEYKNMCQFYRRYCVKKWWDCLICDTTAF